ncbi:MAG: hypothetical protein GWM89_00115 [Candidatus Dadabacteria bacterium]|nr:hypothetical protein [Candidatus Dadabacteria bacterium]NIY20847.1 hypothetical protein [Candidatus Dadabacteria bacterium]
MTKKLPEYDHLVEVREEEKKIYIYRIYKLTNKKQFFTCYELPDKTFDEDKKGFKRFAELLGENIVLDSPLARKILGI